MFAFLLNPTYNICLGLIEQNLCRDISKAKEIKQKQELQKGHRFRQKHEVKERFEFSIVMLGSVNTNDILATLLLFCF